MRVARRNINFKAARDISERREGGIWIIAIQNSRRYAIASGGGADAARLPGRGLVGGAG